VLVGFEDGAPSRPVALLWQSDAGKLEALELGAQDHVILDAGTINLGVAATRGVARGDDRTLNGSLTFAAGAPGVLLVTYTPPVGAPQITAITFSTAGGVTITIPPGRGTTSLTGKIDPGAVSAKVKAE
jgi:hypothetical protein